MLVCPRCGKNNDKNDFIEAFCPNCYTFNLKIPESQIRIEKCKRCEKTRIRGEWQRISKKKIEEYIESKCKGEFKDVEYDMDSGKLVFTIEKSGKKIKKEIEFHVDFSTTICPDCSRMSGGYFEAIIQLRGNKKTIEKQKKLLVNAISRKTFVAKEEEKHGGDDIYVGDSKIVLNLLQELGLKPIITRKLVGVSEGKRLYRTTFMLRFG